MRTSACSTCTGCDCLQRERVPHEHVLNVLNALSLSHSLSLTLCQSVALTLYLTIALTFSVTVSHSHSHSLAPLTRHTFAQSTLNPRSGRAVSGSALHLLAYEYIVRAHCGIHINIVSAIKVPPFDNQHNEYIFGLGPRHYNNQCLLLANIFPYVVRGAAARPCRRWHCECGAG